MLRATLLTVLYRTVLLWLHQTQNPEKSRAAFAWHEGFASCCHSLPLDCRSLVPSSQEPVMMLLIVICISPRAENNLSLEAEFIERVCIHSYMASLHLCFQLPHHIYCWQNNRALSRLLLPTFRHSNSLDRHKHKFIAINHTILLSTRPPEPPEGVVSPTWHQSPTYMAALSALKGPSSN